MAAPKELVGPPRGMRDLLPDEVELRDSVTAAILGTYRGFGYRHIETPALENIRLLTSGQAGENEKLIFKVLKRGEAADDFTRAASIDELVDLGLRFDLTVPLTRYYAANRAKLPRIFKAIQIGNVWRAERPQRGRFRQFVQCDIDVIGVANDLVEVELCIATASALRAIGLEGFVIRLNDRRVLEGLASRCGFAADRHGGVFITVDKLDKIGLDGVKSELAGHGHPEPAAEALVRALAGMPKPSSDVASFRAALGAGEAEAPVYDSLARIVDAVSQSANGAYSIVLDPTLVRGMGYYTGPVFEIAYRDYPFSIAGGGRYDRLIGRLLGEDVPACGFSIGFERIITILQDEKRGAGSAVRRLALIVEPDVAHAAAAQAAAKLRGEGYAPTLLPRDKKLGRQIQGLAAEGYPWLAILRASGLGAVESTAAPAEKPS